MLATTSCINDNRVYQALDNSRKFIGDLVDGRFNALMLTGPAGIGKTYLAREIAKERGIKVSEPRPGTARGLLQALYECRDAPLIILDDLDAVWSDETALNHLKKALDSSSPRVLSHTTGSKTSDIPPFELRASVLFISNKDFSNPRVFSRASYESGVVPLKSRCAMISLPFDLKEIREYTIWLCRDRDMLRDLYFEYPLGQKFWSKKGEWVTATKFNRRQCLNRAETEHVLRHFAQNAGRYPSVSPRELCRFATMRIGKTHDEWETQVEALLSPPAPWKC